MPAKKGDEEGQKRWEWIVFSFMLAVLFGGVLHVALACGYLGSIFPGFVQSNDVRLDRVNFVALQVLAIQMDSKAQKICDNPQDKSLDNELGTEINHLEQAYAFIANRGYDLTQCPR